MVEAEAYSPMFCVFFVYFVLLFGFALAELITFTGCGATMVATTALSPVVFAWFFVVVDWMVVFMLFVMGIFVYDDMAPTFSAMMTRTNLPAYYHYYHGSSAGDNDNDEGGYEEEEPENGQEMRPYAPVAR